MARNYWNVPPEDSAHAVFLERYTAACEYARGTVVDLACGYGTGSQMIAAAGADFVLGGDIDPVAIATAQGHNARPNQIEYIQLDIAVDPLPAKFDPCDWVVSLETVEHLPDEAFRLFFARILKMARVGIVVSTPIIPVAHKKGNFRDSTLEDMRSWFPAGWTQINERILQEKLRPKMPKEDAYGLVVYVRN